MHIEQAVARLMHVADRVRTVATELRRLDGVPWHSLSADRFRAELATVARRVDRSAQLVDHAARTVGAHARALGSAR
jgi:hypothetical protein